MSAYIDPREIYDLLLDYAGAATPASQVTLGRVWTLCEAGRVQGLAMSPEEITRTLPWPGTLAGRPLRQLAAWVKEWDPHQAAVGMAACNAAILQSACLPQGETLEPLTCPAAGAITASAYPNPKRGNLSAHGHALSSSPLKKGGKVDFFNHLSGQDSEIPLSPPFPKGGTARELGNDNNLRVFDHFLPQLAGRRVAVVGRYPGLDRWSERHGLDLTVLERRPGPADLPDPAAEWILPQAQWVFLTASSIPNKTFPRLMALARDATVVLMGPTLPWLAEFHHFGVDYLAGMEVADPSTLRQVVAEGGGVRLFDQAVRYRIAPLDGANTWDWLRRHISQAAAEKDRLNLAMEQWYAHHPISRRFPQLAERETIGLKLSRLDTCAHELWPKLAPEQRSRT